MSIIEELKKEREGQGITQSAMAEELGITSTTLCRYEKGQRVMPSDILERYIKYLGFNLGYFKA